MHIKSEKIKKIFKVDNISIIGLQTPPSVIIHPLPVPGKTGEFSIFF